MSTSPDTQKDKNFSGPPFGVVQSTPSVNSPGLILLKGIFWFALLVGLLVAVGMNYEIVWDVLVGTIFPGLETILEFAEEGLDTFFVLVGMSSAFAPMATAYTGFVLLLAVVYLLSRKAIKVYQKTKAKKEEISQMYISAWNVWYGTITATARDRFTKWWNSLDLMNKVIALIFIVLIGIPLALLLSFILGSLVASLF
jgi:hypothetical protein